MKLSICLIVSLFSGVAFSSHTKVCSKRDDCGPAQCCVLGMERYSIPQCKGKGQIGDWCRAEAEPEDRMLYYPNEVIKQVIGVYTLFCPCADEYTCYKSKCNFPNATNSNIKIRIPYNKFKV